MGFGERKCSVCPKSQETQKTDRISNLPDDILGRILSLLPTEHAVATSILSSKLRNLYQLTTNLDFDDYLSIHPLSCWGTPEDRSSFRKFVDRVLDQCKNSPITRFRLNCAEHAKTDWINVALCLHNVTELDLSVGLSVPFVLQLPELACQNLKVLKLNCNSILHVPNLVTFPCLKVLFFKQVKFPGDGLNRILSGCPLLEELVIIGCDWDGSDNLFFSNPLLKKLTLDAGIDGSWIHFNLPNLVYLEYIGSLPKKYDISNLNSVIHAHFHVDFINDDYDKQELCNTMLDVIKAVLNCEILYFSRQCLEVLASGHFELPVFQNLTRLKLCQGFYVGWNDVLLDFLNSSPCLESLTLMLWYYPGWKTDDDELDNCLLGDHPVPSCVVSCLKIIKVKNFCGLRGETRMVMYFLEKANALEQMVIHCRERNGEREEDILKFPKASKTYSILFKDAY